MTRVRWYVGDVFGLNTVGIVYRLGKENLKFLLSDVFYGKGLISFFCRWGFFVGVHLILIDFLRVHFRVEVGYSISDGLPLACDVILDVLK